MAAQIDGPDPEKAINSVLKGYSLGRRLGSGAFGTVRLAAETSSGKQVRWKFAVELDNSDTLAPQLAIKTVQLSHCQDISSIDRAWREVFILTSLDHEHVIRLHNVCDCCPV